jgi:hypothetical protein
MQSVVGGSDQSKVSGMMGTSGEISEDGESAKGAQVECLHNTVHAVQR